ncbi:MAG TPA: tRNA (adenosine(37)-N6)-threonylcarbamoyltransferase complex dimerization subunit type 1 TsaB [Spirochaeta sp.]|nr:tRNA (adenosine(37)-N6)-threonylcarbamoyltransferase complex dimerization subunit type 1 TsaB [Spirochaeta sp.]
MNILAFDTAGNFLSTGLATEDGFFEENRAAGLRHSEYLLPSVERLMNSAGLGFNDINLIVCSKGPGSFTGLRIGMSTAKGLSSGCNAPIVSVNNLDAIAYNFSFFSGAVMPVIDARKKRFYTAVYREGSLVSDYLDISAEEISVKAGKYERVLFTGPGSGLLKTSLPDTDAEYKFTPAEYSLAPVLISMGRKIYEEEGPDPDDSGPFYIRLSDAELSKQ